MIDTWASVGSAQVGKNCHISGGAGIGGALEPRRQIQLLWRITVF